MGKNARLALRLGALVAFMLAASYAAVPFYSWFCRVTGYAGTPAIAAAAPDRILDREVTITFDANTARDMPWEFRPVTRQMKIRLGQVGLATYEARNPSDRRLAGTASYNVTPDAAGGYFTKIACFCFNLQVLEPGERIEMPVTFYVDPELAQDREGAHVNAITLSYTMHLTDLPAGGAARDKVSRDGASRDGASAAAPTALAAIGPTPQSQTK